MAGQLPLDTKYYPNDFQITSNLLVVPTSGQTAVPLLNVDRPVIIDSVTIYVYPGVGITTNTLPMKIKQTTGGNIPTFATATQDIGSFTDLPVATTTAANAFQTMTFTLTNKAVSNNVVPVGSVVWFQTSAAGSIGNSPTILVQVRWRSQL